jgi:hypothetical protein
MERPSPTRGRPSKRIPQLLRVLLLRRDILSAQAPEGGPVDEAAGAISMCLYGDMGCSKARRYGQAQ